MYSLSTIRAMQDEATQKAKREKVQPFVAQRDGDENIRSCPNMGYYLPEGWEEGEQFFVDSSGLGSADEPALTFEQLLKKIKKGYGYGICEEGQFQIHIQEYRRK